MAGAGLLLVCGWHFGLALAAVPIALLVFGVTHAAGNTSARARMLLGAVFLTIGTLVTRSATTPASLAHLWIPLAIVYLAVVFGPEFLSNLWLYVIFMASAYLFFAQSVTILFNDPRIYEWFLANTKNWMAYQYSFRLLGSMRLAAFVLLISAVMWVLNAACRRINGSWKKKVFLAAACALLLFCFYAQRDMMGMLIDGRSEFFWQEDMLVKRRELAPAELSKLDLADQAGFFASLGDFLLRPIAEPKKNM